MVRLPHPNLARIRDQSGAGFPPQNEPLRRIKAKNEELTLLFTNIATTAETPKDSRSSDAFQPISEARRRPLLAYVVFSEEVSDANTLLLGSFGKARA